MTRLNLLNHDLIHLLSVTISSQDDLDFNKDYPGDWDVEWLKPFKKWAHGVLPCKSLEIIRTNYTPELLYSFTSPGFVQGTKTQ